MRPIPAIRSAMLWPLAGCGPLVEVPDVIEVHVTTPGTECSQGDQAHGTATSTDYVVNRIDDVVTVELEDEYVDAFEAPVETFTTFGPIEGTTGTEPAAGYTTAYLGPGGRAALDVSASVTCKTFGSWPDGRYVRRVTVLASDDPLNEYDEPKKYKVRVDVVVD